MCLLLFLGLFGYLVLDVVDHADDPVGVRGAPVDDGVHADGHAVAGQNLFFCFVFLWGKGESIWDILVRPAGYRRGGKLIDS